MYNLIVEKYVIIKSYLEYRILMLKSYDIDSCIQARRRSMISQVDGDLFEIL